jgi:hypothetical protein
MHCTVGIKQMSIDLGGLLPIHVPSAAIATPYFLV